MPETRRHRGPHPEDDELFAPGTHARLREAGHHLAWLLSRGYASPSSLKLVGDRFSLRARQRTAVVRSVCADAARNDRLWREVAPDQVAGQRLTIDGFNILMTIEAALAGGVLLLGRDGCLRDMASMHGSFRRVEGTRPALKHIGTFCERHGVVGCRWWLDQPVSNSGRLKTLMLELAADHGWDWEVELLPDPDGPLTGTSDIIVSADAGVLDRCGRWFNLAARVFATLSSKAMLVTFADT